MYRGVKRALTYIVCLAVRATDLLPHRDGAQAAHEDGARRGGQTVREGVGPAGVIQQPEIVHLVDRTCVAHYVRVMIRRPPRRRGGGA